MLFVNYQSVTEQQVILQRQERQQQDKVKASVPDKKRLSELENNVEHLKKGKQQQHITFYFVNYSSNGLLLLLLLLLLLIFLYH